MIGVEETLPNVEELANCTNLNSIDGPSSSISKLAIHVPIKEVFNMQVVFWPPVPPHELKSALFLPYPYFISKTRTSLPLPDSNAFGKGRKKADKWLFDEFSEDSLKILK
jgi:hypothetical protein